jgi:hypothetical protein
MKKLLLSTLVLGAMAGSSMAILQVDVWQTEFPAGHDGYFDSFDGLDYDGQGPESAYFTDMTGASYPATRLVGPDGWPLAYHLIFNYDDTPPASPVVSTVVMGFGDCAKTWTPQMFTVFYEAGPVFPKAWGFNGTVAGDAFTPECIGGEVDAVELPVSFGLADAYPNPFNPSTTIDFSIPAADVVTLNVFNINGQLVRSLVNGTVERGAHSVTFDAGNLSSGVYLYTLETSSQSLTKKMVLVK